MFLPLLAAILGTLWTVHIGEVAPISVTWPVYLLVSYFALAALRSSWTVRLTRDELLIRYPIGGQRVPRAEVESAHFNYWGLIIRKRGGGFAFAFVAPKWTSTELSSGGRPGPDSVAFQITRWAQSERPEGDPAEP
ncbi:hypothetical protein EV646_116152 [Kribbella antiqua]|uniref:Uncharacterized protein n=2 Tax=Kribbella antiqua TaxID=2512217 RepID=A0A4V2S2M6_9ACTN|nr:hypothetical protein EV646_116152 [Kribbella antiqua]